MKDRRDREQRGQSIILVAVALLALVIFAAIAVDISNTYVHRRTAQNGADAAALAGARELARQLNEHSGTPGPCYTCNEFFIKEDMNEFAELNGVPDSDGVPANYINTNVVGYYLNADRDRIQDENGHLIVIGVSGMVHPDARGVEAVTYSVAPTFFGSVMGLDGLGVQAEAAVVFEGACTGRCVLPIAAYTETFLYNECYNIYDGDHPGSFGWLNFQFSADEDASDCHCSAECTEYNMDESICASGELRVGDWVASDSGLANTKDIRNVLLCYMGLPLEPGGDFVCDEPGMPDSFTIIIYENTDCLGGSCEECGIEGPHGNRGFAYQIAGFAEFQLLGFSLATGGGAGQSYGHDGVGCLGPEPTGGNRLTGRFIERILGDGGNCGGYGTITAPTMVK